MRFICDDNLGKLAKYLRILGFDTIFREPISNAKLLHAAATEERFLLTRDRRLTGASHPFGILLLENDNPLDQLRMTISKLNLTILAESIFHRCTKCNEICNVVDKALAANHLFPFILQTQEIISQCPSCKRFYWKGTHYTRLLQKLRSVIPDEAIEGRWPD